MGCGSCASGACGVTTSTPKGCKSNGNCATGGCNKLNSFDWLGNMMLPNEQKFNVVEIKFKAGKKDFFRNNNNLTLHTGDPVVVEMQSGYHIGYVSLQGELVRLQMKKKKVKETDDIKNIYRIASEKELDRFDDIQKREISSLYRAREIIQELKLSMKLSDIEYQADNSKATFYYSADDRVDFRELIKLLASEFKVRIEMRQISLRQEASRLGGIGSCGRELCCSTWLTEFKSVSTTAARYQNLSLNPVKLSGQCGRLKCCLNYELDTYLDALIDIPNIKAPIKLANGEATLQKVDIFKKIMWFSVNKDTNWVPVPASRIAEIVEQNKIGKTPASLATVSTLEEKPKRPVVAKRKSHEQIEEKPRRAGNGNATKAKTSSRKSKSPHNKTQHTEPSQKRNNPRNKRPNQRRVSEKPKQANQQAAPKEQHNGKGKEQNGQYKKKRKPFYKKKRTDDEK